jgi:hypothetical protein
MSKRQLHPITISLRRERKRLDETCERTGSEIFIGPFQSVFMIHFGVTLGSVGPYAPCLGVRVECSNWSPMECGLDMIITSCAVGVVVSSRFGNLLVSLDLGDAQGERLTSISPDLGQTP